MTVQERLELIKSREKDAIYLLRGTMIRSDWYWLIEQAERVQELKQVMGDLVKNVVAFETLWLEEKRKNQRYKQALEEIRGLYPLRNVGYQVSEIRKIVTKALEGEKHD